MMDSPKVPVLQIFARSHLYYGLARGMACCTAEYIDEVYFVVSAPLQKTALCTSGKNKPLEDRQLAGKLRQAGS